ncbi:MAG: hypothetical protein P1U70_24280, partial [Saprospiraceae bacterium]|nr:hypothetical protein [Saprospiraceae bacterium]
TIKALIISILIITYSFIHTFYLRSPLSDNIILNIIDFAFGIPVYIPFMVAFAGENIIAIISIIIEIIVFTLIIRFIIKLKQAKQKLP